MMDFEYAPPTKLISVDRREFTLALYRRMITEDHYERTRKYRIAVGALGYETPSGLYLIQAKARNPDWKMPNSPWVPEADRGNIIPAGDPRNPLVYAFLKLTDDGVGIHGTHALESLGTAASHGCIRMAPEDIKDLYKRVGTGVPVHIH